MECIRQFKELHVEQVKLAKLAKELHEHMGPVLVVAYLSIGKPRVRKQRY